MSDGHATDEADTGVRPAGITEAMVEATLGDLGHPATTEVLGEATVAALRLADVMAGFFPKVDGAFYEELRLQYTDGQILELGAALSVASGWQRMIEAFGIRPDVTGELRDLG